MLRPFLLIGVGGSGGKTLRVVREDLLRRLAQAGWEGALPRAWQFLHIDVPTQADGNDPDLPPQLPLSDYQGLVAPGLTYRTIDRALAGEGRTPMGDAIAGWRPDPQKVNVPVNKGAGQFRTLGRMITVANLENVSAALLRARQHLTGTEVVGELQKVTRILGGEPLPTLPDPVVVVVSSIAGGSGAGAVIDICDAVRALGDNWASESVGFLYAPDVFDYLPEEKRKGVRPNALASLSEILNAYWNNEGPSEETATLLAKHGVQLGAVDRMGPRYPFLVGNRNEHVSFGTQNDIYRAMGRSIAAWVASPPLQDQMVAYTQGNWTASASGMKDHLPFKLDWAETPFSALGSARVGLGRDRFQDYAAQLLAREAVERALRQHEGSRRPNDDRIPRVLVADVAEAAFGSFLATSRLDERGEESNEIIDALRPEDAPELCQELRQSVIAKITSEMPAKGWSTETARQRIVSELRAREGRFLDQHETGRRERARVWVVAIQDNLTRQAGVSIAREGAAVTAELFGKLATELRQVREELKDEAARFSRWAADLDQQVGKILEQPGAEMLLATNPQVSNAVKRGVQALEWRAEAHLRELVADIIPDLVEGVIEPLATAIRHGYQALEQEEAKQVDGRQSQISLWPSDDVVPQRLLPASNEFLVDPPSEWPRLLQGQISKTVATADAGGARREAVMQVLLGTDDVDAGAQFLVERRNNWVPRDHHLQTGASAAATRAAFHVTLAAQEILDRALAWTSRPGTAIGKFTAQGLKDYLDPKSVDPTEHHRRLGAFEGQFIAAVNAAAPLVSINTGVLVQVHDKSAAPSDLFFTEIPFPDRSPAREVVTRVLQGKGMWTNSVEKALGEGNAPSVDVFSVLREPYEPVVFDSLMKPIASEWGARAKSPDLRSEFWRWRRARPLTEFLPMAPAIRAAMVRGFFTASLLGQLDLTETSAAIFVPSESGGPGRMVNFPTPLLAPHPPRSYDYLPVILKSALLAMVDVNTKASLEPVLPYVRLRELGRSGNRGQFEDYDAPAPELEAWVLEGRVAEGAPTPEDPASAVDWEKRRALVEQRFGQLRIRYATDLFAEVDRRKDPFDVPAVYELKADILSALDDLQRVVRHLEPKQQGGWF